MMLDLLTIFLIFFLIFIYITSITVFGYFILFSCIKKSNVIQISLTNMIKSFGIGVSIHIFFSVLLIFFKIFNFFTGYLPIILIDLYIIFYVVYKEPNISKKQFSAKIVVESLRKNKILYIVLLSGIIMTFIIELYFILDSITYFGNDAFQWFNHILYLQKYQTINYEYIRAYPPGFVIFCTMIVSFIENYYFIYYFLKFIPIFFNLINVVVVFELARSFFNKESLIFLSLATYLSMNYLLFRYMIPVSSLLGTSSGFIFLLFLNGEIPVKKITGRKFRSYFYKNFKKKDNILKAFLIFTIFMTQPLYSFIFLSLYILFLLYLCLIREKLDKQNLYRKKFGLISYFTKILSFLFLCGLIILPYIVGLSFYLDYLILETYIRYAIPEFDIILIKNLLEILPNLFSITGLSVRYKSYISIILEIYFQTIDYGLIVIAIGIFIPFIRIFNLTETQKNVLRFIKLSLIFTILITSLHYIMLFINIGVIQTTNSFIGEYYFRILELFSGYWILLFAMVFKTVFKKSKKFIEKIKINQITRKYHLKTVSAILIIILGGYFYLINFIRISPNLYFEDIRTQAVQYVGNYFYQTPIKENKTIILENLENKHVYDLIMDRNLHKAFFNSSINTNYTIFMKFVLSFNNSKYVFLELNNLPRGFINSFSKDFIILYRDDEGFVFGKLRIHFNLKK